MKRNTTMSLKRLLRAKRWLCWPSIHLRLRFSTCGCRGWMDRNCSPKCAKTELRFRHSGSSSSLREYSCSNRLTLSRRGSSLAIQAQGREMNLPPCAHDRGSSSSPLRRGSKTCFDSSITVSCSCRGWFLLTCEPLMVNGSA
jgi:hypothetical protein